MPEAEVNLKYTDWPVPIVHSALLITLPLMLLFVLWSALCLVMGLAEGTIQVGPTLLVFTAELAAVGATVLSIGICADQSVHITREGISLPFALCPAIGLRAHYSWSDLKGVRFKPQPGKGILSLYFSRGAAARFNLNRLPDKDVEDLIVAIDVWGGGADSFPALLDARANLQPAKLAQGTSFTQMWEEELSRRFASTNFIPLEPGHKLQDGKYEIERQLAFGGFSAIYLVCDASKTHFVLKEAVVPANCDESLKVKAEEMLERETSLLSKLDNPHIASVRDAFVEDGRHYLLMDYIAGTDLRKLVQEFGPQSQDKVIVWARQLADILAYLHSQNPPVIHRDVSPDNLMLREDGQLSIIDFGAANQFLGTATATMIGKQAYIAPEQLRGKPETASDIYGFGCTLYFLLTGQDPEPLSVSHPLQKCHSVSKQMDELVASCTAMEPEDRPASGRVLEKMLRQIKG